MKNGAMFRLIQSDDIERKHLKYFIEIDRVLEGFRQSLRLGNILDEETLKKLTVRHSDESRSPEPVGKTGFRLSPE